MSQWREVVARRLASIHDSAVDKRMDLADAIRRFEAEAPRIRPEACRASAERFSTERFRREFADFVAARWAEFASREARP